MKKASIKKIIPPCIWKKLRERLIVRHHRKVAAICEKLVSSYSDCPESHFPCKALKSFPEGTAIVWQYWAQGYGDVPEIVRECLDSVDKYCQSYTIIRLDDTNVGDYLELPEFVMAKIKVFGYAFFSDLLRSLLLAAYGGIWMDATILLTAPLSGKYFEKDFFAFQRDPNQQHKDYWENTYAYYFSWAKGFRVNFLSSFMAARPGSELIDTLSGCMLEWWKRSDYKPDYFFFQILFDVLVRGKFKDKNCAIVSDCPPHYLQQHKNDPNFYIRNEEEILQLSSIHKLTYK